MHPGIVEPDVSAFIGLVIAVAVVAAAVRFVRVPYTVALVLTGLALALAPDAPHLQLTPSVILTIFLPVLLFHGAYNLNLTDLRANLTPVALLAVPGVALTAALVGVTLHLITGLPWGAALLFGTIVSATDPVAVLATFAEVGAPRRLTTIVNAESLFNDGTALALFTTVLGVTLSHQIDVGAQAERFVVAVGGALALGGAVAVVGATVITQIDDALLETTLTLILAYGGYLLADHLALSGALETATAGVLLGARSTRIMSPTTRLQSRATWEFLDFLANSLLFLLMGLQLHQLGPRIVLHSSGTLLWTLVVALGGMTLARVVAVVAVSRLLIFTRHPLPAGWPLVLTWAGLRGAVSLAAGLSLPASLPGRNDILTLIFASVLFTLLVQGLTISPLLKRLGLATPEASRHAFELTLGRLRATDAARHEIATLLRERSLDEHVATRLDDDYAQQHRTLSEELDTMYHGNTALERQQELTVTRRLLRVQRASIHDSYARGLLSGEAQHDLIRTLDDKLAALEPTLDDD